MKTIQLQASDYDLALANVTANLPDQSLSFITSRDDSDVMTLTFADEDDAIAFVDACGVDTSNRVPTPVATMTDADPLIP